MYEAIPVALGVVLAFGIQPLVDRRLRLALVAAFSLVIGFFVAAAVGELSANMLFGIFDAAQVAFATVVTGLVIRRVAEQRARS